MLTCGSRGALTAEEGHRIEAALLKLLFSLVVVLWLLLLLVWA